MEITDSKQLAKAIDVLTSKKAIEEDTLLKDIYIVKQRFDLVHQVNNLLPRKVQLREALSTALSDSVMNTVTYPFKSGPKESFFKRTRNTILRKAVTAVFHNNSQKIRSVGLAIVKNLLK